MNEHSLSMHNVVAGALWAAAIGLVVAGLVLGMDGLGQVGLLCAAAGAVSQVRGYICRATERVVTREQNAFDLGRDYGSDVRSLR